MNVVGEVAAKKSAEKAQERVRTNLKRRHTIEKGAFGVLWAAGVVVIFVLFFVIFYLFIQSGKFFVGPENLMEDTTIVTSDNEMREEIIADPNAIGYVSFTYLDEQVKPVHINGIQPTVENVANGWYPIVQNLYMMTHGQVSPLAQAWMDFAMSQEGQAAIAEIGFVPLEGVESYTADTSLSGELTVSGSESMVSLANALAVAFESIHPDVTITIEADSSTAGIRAVGKDNVDIGMSSREIRDYEFVRYDGLEAFNVGRDGIAIVANPQNPVGSLTVNQARDLFSGATTSWSDVGGRDAEVVPVSRSTTCGCWDGFQQWVMGKGALMASGLASGNFRLVFQNLWATVKFVGRFLTTKPLPGMGGLGGISTTIVTTVYLVVFTLLIATPLGVGAAIYLVEYAGEMSGQSQWMHRMVSVIRFAVETLAGVPSIIYGLFGFALFVTVMQLGLSMLSGALAGACLILPTVIRTTEEALLTVPRSYREGSLALGATKWQTNYQVVLPAALPGIVTGIILGAGRIISETAVFYVTLGGSINFPESVMDQGRTMVLHLYSLMMDANAPDPAMGTAMVIIFVIVLINLAINYFSNQLSKRMRGTA